MNSFQEAHGRLRGWLCGRKTSCDWLKRYKPSRKLKKKENRISPSGINIKTGKCRMMINLVLTGNSATAVQYHHHHHHHHAACARAARTSIFSRSTSKISPIPYPLSPSRVSPYPQGKPRAALSGIIMSLRV